MMLSLQEEARRVGAIQVGASLNQSVEAVAAALHIDENSLRYFMRTRSISFSIQAASDYRRLQEKRAELAAETYRHNSELSDFDRIRIEHQKGFAPDGVAANTGLPVDFVRDVCQCLAPVKRNEFNPHKRSA